MRCKRAETTRDCPLQHQWSDDQAFVVGWRAHPQRAEEPRWKKWTREAQNGKVLA
jgi:hypothetical protein